MTAVAVPDTTEPTDATPSSRPTPRGLRPRRVRLVATLAGVLAVALLSAACTPQQIAEDAVAKYFTSAQAPCADKIVKRESNYNASALSPDGLNIGLFQINKVHLSWVTSTYGYSWADLKDPNKNAQVAKGLSNAAKSYYGDPWQPWRLDGKARTDGSCAA